MGNTESLVFDLLLRDRASSGLSDIGKAADGASRNTDALTKRLNDLSRKSVEARLKLAGDKEALASLDKMDARLISLDRRVASPNMKVEGAARAIAEISAVDIELDKLGGQGGTAEVATASLGAGGLAGVNGMGAAIAAGVALSPVIATVAVGLGGLAVGAYGTISPILKASQATGGLAANMATLSPQQQQMARQLITLQGEAGGFAKSLQPQVVKIWGDALGIAGGVLHDVQPVAAAAGDGLHSVMDALNMNFNSAEWQNFFTWMAVNAAPDVKLLGQNLIDLVNTLPGLLTTLQPVATSLLTVLDGVLKVVHGMEVVKTLTSHAGDPTALLAAMNAMNGTAGAATAVGASAAAAALKVGTLNADMAILGTTTSNSTIALQAYSDLWNIFVGNSVSDQQAVLSLDQAFESYNKTVKQSGRTSLAAQQSFLSIFDTARTGLESLHQHGASVQRLNSYYATSIARLSALHGLTPLQRADVQGLTKDYLAWANSVTGLSGNTVKAAGVIRGAMLLQLGAMHQLVPQVKGDTDALATSILKTGTNSRSTAGDRQRLIADLEKSGLSAAQARQAVIDFQGRIDALKGKTVPIGATFSGTGHIKASQSMTGGQVQTVGNLLFVAEGGVIPGGYSRTDNRLAWVRSGEGVLQPGAVAALGGAPFIHRANALYGDVPVSHYAGGGLVGMEAGMAGIAPFGGKAGAHFGAFAGQVFGKAAETAFAAAAAVISGANAGGRFIGVGSPAGSGPAAFAQVAARMGWGPAELAAWNYVEMREAGYSLTATNPSSGAYGMAQFINGAGEYAQWGGNSTTYIGQATAMANYIKSRYGDPIAAAAHEACVPLDAEILTRRGWLTYDQLQPGDETIGFDPATGRNAWTPVNQVHIYEDAPLVRLTSKTWEATCTPNHRWVAEKFIQGQADGYRHEMARAGSFGTRHRLRLAAETDTGDGPAIDDREAELLGWVLGDGSVAHIKNKTASSPSIRLYQSKPAHVAVIDELVDGLLFNRCIRQMNKPSGESGLPLVTWEFTRAYSAELLKRSGYDHKGPVPFVLSLSPRQRTAFMRGVFGAEGSLVGDGTFSGVGNAKYGSYRRTKAYPQNDGPKQDAIILGVYLSGHRPGISELDNRGTTIGRWTVRTVAATVRETKPFIGGEKIKRADAGRGTVFCVTTGLGSWTMRQGRQAMLTGNSFNWYDAGGVLGPGLTLAYNGTGRDEYVTKTPPGGGGDTYITLNVTVPVGAHPAETGRVLAGYLMEFKKRGGKY